MPLQGIFAVARTPESASPGHSRHQPVIAPAKRHTLELAGVYWDLLIRAEEPSTEILCPCVSAGEYARPLRQILPVFEAIGSHRVRQRSDLSDFEISVEVLKLLQNEDGLQKENLFIHEELASDKVQSSKAVENYVLGTLIPLQDLQSEQWSEKRQLWFAELVCGFDDRRRAMPFNNLEQASIALMVGGKGSMESIRELMERVDAGDYSVTPYRKPDRYPPALLDEAIDAILDLGNRNSAVGLANIPILCSVASVVYSDVDALIGTSPHTDWACGAATRLGEGVLAMLGQVRRGDASAEYDKTLEMLAEDWVWNLSDLRARVHYPRKYRANTLRASQSGT